MSLLLVFPCCIYNKNLTTCTAVNTSIWSPFLKLEKDSVSVFVCVNKKGEMEDWMKQDKLSDVPFWFSRAETEQTEDLDTWLCVFFFFFLNIFSRRVPGKRRKRSRRVKAAARASISPSANTTARPVERWAQMERDRKSGHCLMWCSNEGIMGREVKGTSENVRQLTVNNRAASEHSLSFSLGVLLQAICAKCSKTLDNKTSRVCPECYEASVSLENLGVSEQRRKAAPEVRQTKATTQKHWEATCAY